MKKTNNPLELTEKEKEALKIYGGAMFFSKSNFPVLCSIEYSYGMINSLFFDGIESEMERVLIDQKKLFPEHLENPEEILELTVAIYSAIYKKGKQISSTKKTVRSERATTMAKLEETKETISFTSTTKQGIADATDLFPKENMVIMRLTIKPDTPALDYQDVFVSGKEYIFHDEEEVLLPPDCKIEITGKTNAKEPGKDMFYDEKTDLYDIYDVTVSPPEKTTELTEEEKHDKENMEKIFQDEKLRKNAITVLKIIRDSFNDKITEKETIKQLGKRRIEKYSKWKEALRKLIKYRFREVALEIDQAIQEYQQYVPGDIATLSSKSPEINTETVEDVMENGRGTAYREYPGGRHRCARVKITVEMLIMNQRTKETLQGENNMDYRENNILMLTKREKEALQIYGGNQIMSQIFPTMAEYESTYGVINAMFFEGINNELVRVIEDERDLPIQVIKEPDEMLELILSLYSAMYKRGQKMQEPKDSKRIERVQTIPELMKKGVTISNLSTTKIRDVFERTWFNKNKNAFLEVHIMPGTPCVDYVETFGEDEDIFLDEEEILVAPGCKIDIKKSEKEQKDMEEELYEVTIYPPEKAKPLTKEEQEDKKRMYEIFNDKTMRNSAIQVFKGLKSRFDAQKMMIEGTRSNDINNYVQWKKALQTIIKYEFREIALQIDQALAQQNTQYSAADIATLSSKSPEINVGTVAKVMGNSVGQEQQTEENVQEG